MDPGGILLFVWTCFLAVISSGFAEVYSNTWVVYTEKNKAYVDEIAQKRGFINHGQLGELEGHYLLEHKKLGSRMRRSLTKHTVDFLQETHIKYAEQQKVLRRQKREPFSDPYFGDQWYIHNTGMYKTRYLYSWFEINHSNNFIICHGNSELTMIIFPTVLA